MPEQTPPNPADGTSAGTITSSHCAQLLGIDPGRLREWVERFDFPRSMPGADGERQFLSADVSALQRALDNGHSLTTAMLAARAGAQTLSDSERPAPPRRRTG